MVVVLKSCNLKVMQGKAVVQCCGDSTNDNVGDEDETALHVSLAHVDERTHHHIVGQQLKTGELKTMEH